MQLREFKELLNGSDELEVIIVIDGVEAQATLTITGVEEGIDEESTRRELWILAEADD